MIFDFISGEAGTQERGEKFAKWLAEDTDLTQKEKKSVVEKIKDMTSGSPIIIRASATRCC